MVPASIISTFQLMVPATLSGGRMPSTRNSTAVTGAMLQRQSEKTSSSTYMTPKRISARVIGSIEKTSKKTGTALAVPVKTHSIPMYNSDCHT